MKKYNRSDIPVRNSRSILTALVMMRLTVPGWGRHLRWLNNRHAKSVCMPLSWLMSSFENVKPGMRTLSQV
jgi:hypothetical protein